MYYSYSENKGADQLRGHYVFAYVKCCFSHDVACFYLFIYLFIYIRKNAVFLMMWLVFIYLFIYLFIYIRKKKCSDQILITNHLSDINWFVCVQMRLMLQSCQDGATTSLVLTTTQESQCVLFNDQIRCRQWVSNPGALDSEPDALPLRHRAPLASTGTKCRRKNNIYKAIFFLHFSSNSSYKFFLFIENTGSLYSANDGFKQKLN